MTAFEVVDLTDGTVIDVIAVGDDGAVTYESGAAESIVEARLRLLPEPGEALASLAGWSNGYLKIARLDSVESQPMAESAALAPIPPQPVLLAEVAFGFLAT